MTYIRDPFHPMFWESDGMWNGKFMAKDGTLHDSIEEVWEYEKNMPDIPRWPNIEE
jgi:hypothetical protein